MLRLIARKFVLILFLLPTLNFVGYLYATIHPRLFGSSSGVAAPPTVGDNDYGRYLQNLLSGNLGQVGNQSVASIIADPIKHSLILVGVAIFVAILFGFLVGLISISPRTKRLSPQGLLILSAGASMPGFILGGVALSFMVYQTLWGGKSGTLLPISGYGLDAHLILPVIILAIQPTMYIAKVTANLLENELQQDYVRVARSKGLSWTRLLWTHAMPNMIAPVLLTISESLRLIVGALVIVEAIFIWPGIGRIFLFTIGLRLDGRSSSIFFGHPELLAAIVVVLGGILLFSDLLINVLSYWLDPRLGMEIK
ncbi:MAG: ABC transporter permease [Chloroflexi bacterium]|nr:ABC transporter permease [Chloroflexota bacterium]